MKPYKIDPKDVEIPPWLTDSAGMRQELVEYYESINRFDQGVGMILANLEKEGLADDTLVFVTSDNGPPFVNAKTTMYESGTCLPFMIRDPALVKKGVKGVINPNMVSYMDILPTMLDFCGIPLDIKTRDLSPPRRGRSVLPVLSRSDVAPESEWQHHIYGSHTYHQRENYWPTRIIRNPSVQVPPQHCLASGLPVRDRPVRVPVLQRHPRPRRPVHARYTIAQGLYLPPRRIAV